MICAIHQPQAFPWLGYFAKILQADLFVFLDNVQFKKNEWQNRNKIKTDQGGKWLTVPVIHNFGQDIKDVKINNREKWKHKHLQTFKTYYGKAPYFSQYFPELEALYNRDWEYLADFNIKIIHWLMTTLTIATETSIASRLTGLSAADSLSADERLVQICKIVGADTYLSGSGGQNYLDQSLFPRHDIQLEFQSYDHPQYQQLHGDFISHLTTLDLLLNHGPQSLEIIKRGIT